MELQLRTKRMDDIAEIGPANHLEYENARKRNASSEMRSRKVNAFILMKHMKEA